MKSKDKVIRDVIDKFKGKYGEVKFTSEPHKIACCLCKKKTTTPRKVILLLGKPYKPAPRNGRWCCPTCKNAAIEDWRKNKKEGRTQFLDYVCSEKCETMLILKYL